MAAHIEVDTALVSKLERGERKAHREQLSRIADFLDVEEKELVLLWLADKIMDDIQGEPQALEALKFVENQFNRSMKD